MEFLAVAPSVFRGRYTARTDAPFVVFLIGMRINHFWKVRQWLPTMLAMRPMLIELYSHPEKGFLSAEITLTLRGPVLIQYWRSFDDLDRFARSRSDPHLPAWTEFNRTAARNGSAGVFHETYLVQPGQFEAVYANMPRFGLARAFEHLPASGARETARGRLGGAAEPAVPSS
jgi:hypothetical protein